MLEGIKILAERIESNGVDDDYRKFSKWDALVRQVLTPRPDGVDIFTEEEREHIRQALTRRARDKFNAEVLQTLSAGPEEQESDESWFSQAMVKQEGQMVGYGAVKGNNPTKMIVSPQMLKVAKKLMEGK